MIRWTQLRHEALAMAGQCVLQPSSAPNESSYYARIIPNGTDVERVSSSIARTLRALKTSGLLDNRARPGALAYEAQRVKRTPDGDRLLDEWTKRYGTPGEKLSPEALAAVPEIAAWLEHAQFRYKGDVSAGIGVAALLLTKQLPGQQEDAN